MLDVDPSDAGEDAPPPSVAIIGMAGRFPQSPDLASFWANLAAGRDCITRLGREESIAAGVDPRSVADPRYVGAKGVLEDALCFDAGVFGYSPREAEIIDPQQRQFLECAMAALEDAGLDPSRFPGSIGVFGGQAASSYVQALRMDPRNADLPGEQVMIGNDKDFLTSKVSYKLNLKGPSVVVQSACSTSLVALALAYQSLLDFGCDVALAGGVCIGFPDHEGYVFEEGGTHSPDGYLRAFDSRPSGIVGGNGVGVVVLKRLEDAIADRDPIHAVVRGAAMNNDGSVKIGYTAPSVDGQADAVSTALALGDVDPATIGYVEAHGTATRLGDPIEVAALTKAFRRRTAKTAFCGIGSVKTNIGHLDAAAGVAGLIKAVLALKHEAIPPTLNVETLNPQIDFAASPFRVCKALEPWPKGEEPRRASVSSFGIGGTNAHVVIEEAPAPEAPEAPARDAAVLLLSANSSSALKRVASRLGAAFRADPGIDVHDAAHTLQTGRKAWRHRMAVVCRSAADGAELLEAGSAPLVNRGQAPSSGVAPVAFLFPGQGAQHLGMMRGLYEAEPAFRATIDQCAELLRPEIGHDIRELLRAPASDAAAAAELDRTRTTQPALFAVELALARLWMSWGVQPAGMLGHSIGEYVAACLAGVMDLPDALRVVARRGALMESLPEGAMASVPLPAEEVEPLLGPGLSIASVLGARLCVVSGRAGPLAAFEERLKGYGVASRPVRTSHAFHSAEMDAILGRFADIFAGVTLRAPTIPFMSNLTGTWITAEQATDPSYWASQLRAPVRLWDGLAEVTAQAGTVCLEVGPGRGLSALALNAVEGRRVDAVASCRDRGDRRDTVDDETTLLGAAGRLWALGVPVDWAAVSGPAARNKLHLPSYPFEREEYSLIHAAGPAMDAGQARERPSSDLLYAPAWRRVPPKRAAETGAALDWLVFCDGLGLGERCAALLAEAGQRVTTVGLAGRGGTVDHRLAPNDPDGCAALFRDLEERGRSPDRVLHLWGVGGADPAAGQRERVAAVRALGFDSLLDVARALGARKAPKPCLVCVASTGLYDVVGDAVEPEKALLIGPVRVIPAEYDGVGCRSVDLALRDIERHPDREARLLVAEAGRPEVADAALRGGDRWVRSFESIYFDPHGDPAPELPSRLRAGGAYLITGGLGGIGLAIARRLAERVGARLVLTGRTLPEDGGAAIRGEIAGLGGEALTLRADVADPHAVRAALDEAEGRFGPIHGVVHAAGVAGRGIIQSKTGADVDRVLAPKVEGTLVLDEALASRPLDFFVACSSVSTLIGAPGQAEYTAANAFQDSFAQARRRDGVRHLSIDWDRWAEVGMAVREMAQQHGAAPPPDLPPGLAAAQGAECFEIALDSAEPQIAVALDHFEWISRYGPPRAQQAAAAKPQRSYERPELDTAFVAPTDPTEVAIAGLFEAVLGIKDVGIDDNFFDLGGHSLLGVKLVNSIQEVLKAEIGIGELFGLPTVRSLARAVAARRDSGRGAPAAAV